MVEEKLPISWKRPTELITMVFFWKFVSFMKFLHLVSIFKRTSCICKPNKSFLLLWEEELVAPHFKLVELTITEFAPNLFDFLTEFFSKFCLYAVKKDWLLKIRIHLEKYGEKLLL